MSVPLGIQGAGNFVEAGIDECGGALDQWLGSCLLQDGFSMAPSVREY
jgi:hypothetical protein